MFPKPRADLTPNTADYERLPLVKPTGFREYDARWPYESEINLLGVQALGRGLGTFIHQWFPEATASSGAYALVTMGAVVAATTHAPVSAIIIICCMDLKAAASSCWPPPGS